MNYKIDNLDFTDKKLISILNNIDSSNFYINITYDDLCDIVLEYIKDILDIDLSESDANLEVEENNTLVLDLNKVDNLPEIKIILKDICDHFGFSVIKNKTPITYKILNTSPLLRKIFKNSDIEINQNNKSSSITILYDDYDDFRDTWIESYFIKRKENSDDAMRSYF